MDNLKRKPNLAFLGLVKVNQLLKQVVHVMGRECCWLASRKAFQRIFKIAAYVIAGVILGTFSIMVLAVMTWCCGHGWQSSVPAALRWHYMGIGALEAVIAVVSFIVLDKVAPPFARWFGARYHTAHVYVKQNR